jgi:hypothetical protein
MLARNELAAYIADNYGACDRGSDCYHGTDARGQPNGCLKTGWRGVACKHWHPVAACSWEELAAEMRRSYGQGSG